MNRDQKKHQKQIERDRQKLQDRKHLAQKERERKIREQFPDVIIDPTGGDPEFVRIVTEANATINFEEFDNVQQEYYRQLKKKGFTEATNWTHGLSDALVKVGHDQAEVLPTALPLHYGHVVYERIPEDIRNRYLPYNDALIIPNGRDITINFSSMMSRRGTHGTIFFSKLKPTITHQGKSWVVGYSRHAIEQVCKRLNPRYLSHEAAGDIHCFFSSHTYFEIVNLCDGQPAFVLYDNCSEPKFARYNTYVEQIFGEHNLNPAIGTPHYLVGYCPIEFEDEFAKGKTFLYPGYNNTPECGLIENANISRSEKRRLFGMTKGLTADEVVTDDNPELIKWFHDNGVPQVKLIKEETSDFEKAYGMRRTPRKRRFPIL